MPYTYLIGWSKLNRYYYGVRYAKDCNPNELWVTYFTSSKHVQKFREEHGEPDIVQIRKVFGETSKAIIWEHKVLKRIGTPNDDIWLNKTDNKSIPPEYDVNVWTEERKKRFSQYRMGQKHDEATKRKISQTQKGVPREYLKGVKRPDHSDLMKTNNPNAKTLMYEGTIYNTQKELAKAINRSEYHIRKMIENHQVKVIQGVI